MKLSKKALKDQAGWQDMDVELPAFDIEAVREKTLESPKWIHFGGGNIFRGFVAHAQQKLLDQGLSDTGIIAVDSFDFEVIDKVYKAYDNLSLLVLMGADGSFKKKVIASVVESLAADYQEANNMETLGKYFEADSLQMVSFTITEKGYGLSRPDGSYFPVVERDIAAGPKTPVHTMGMIASLMYQRYQKNQGPITLVSMDNCSHNGDKLKAGVVTMAKEWLALGFVEPGFVDYLLDDTKVTYPLSMIDKITPRPSQTVQKDLEASGIEDMDVIVTDKNSYMAPFVNAEVSEYLVIEDTFTNGRPPLEQAGVIFTDRETVNQVETMKVTTCLNPLHTALAVSGCLLGYTLIADEMKDPALKGLIEAIGYEEGLKVVVDPGIISPKAFIDEVVNERFANPYIPDSPQRIATDTSQKVGIRFGETIKAYVASKDLEVTDLEAIPMAIALWCRYLLGIDDSGKAFQLSSDPLLETLQGEISSIDFGRGGGNQLKGILSNIHIFGSDLYEVGLGDIIEGYFNQLNTGVGAIRQTLDAFIQ